LIFQENTQQQEKLANQTIDKCVPIQAGSHLARAKCKNLFKNVSQKFCMNCKPQTLSCNLIKVLKWKVKISRASTYKVLMPLFPAQQFAGQKIKIIKL
jgi:hypothetical protein